MTDNRSFPVLHLFWKVRPAGENELDLIIFEGDAVFSKVEQSPDNNVFALTFESSQEKHFVRSSIQAALRSFACVPSSIRLTRSGFSLQFWFQDISSDYSSRSSHINSIIANPDFVPPHTSERTNSFLRAPASDVPATPAPRESAASTPAAPNPTRTVGFDLGSSGPGGYSPAQLAQLREMLEAQAGPGGAGESDSGEYLSTLLAFSPSEADHAPFRPPLRADVHLQDILTPQLLTPLLSSPDLLHSLVPSLPSDLPLSSPPTTAEVTAVIESAQFQDGVRGLDRALRTGMLGGLVQGLGLPESAGSGVEAFLRAIGEQAGEGRSTEVDEGGSMETD